MSDQSWRDDARCLDADPDAFFPSKGGWPDEALRVCSVCPVVEECLEDALSMPGEMDYGIRGGMSERSRKRLRWKLSADRRRAA